jgi:hypothetical protein
VTTASGIRDMYRLTRSCGVRLHRARTRPAARRPACSIDPWIAETQCVTTKVMIFSCRKPDRPSHSNRLEPKQRPKKLKRQKECRDRIGAKQTSNTDMDYQSDSSRPHLLTAKTHAGVIMQAQKMRRPTAIRRTYTSLAGALALHGVSENLSGSHLGSTLRPGRAVLTRGVSRRSGSVACVHAEASPNEVLAGT